MPIVNPSECLKGDHKEGSIVCVGGSGSGGCQGDSGGPLTVKVSGQNILVGVLSHGTPVGVGCSQVTCHCEYMIANPFNSQQTFDVFMDMQYYFPWVNATIIENGGMQACDFSIDAPPAPGECVAVRKLNHMPFPRSFLHANISTRSSLAWREVTLWTVGLQ